MFHVVVLSGVAQSNRYGCTVTGCVVHTLSGDVSHSVMLNPTIVVEWRRGVYVIVNPEIEFEPMLGVMADVVTEVESNEK